MPQLAIHILNAALLALCSYEAAGIVNRVVADSLQPRAVAHEALPVAASTAAASWRDREPILERNLFGATLAGDAPPVVEVVEENVEETKLPLTLLATIADTNNDFSRAAIFDTRARKSEVLRPGDTLESHPGVRVDRIERGRILLRNQNRLEELALADTETTIVAEPARKSRRGEARRRAARPKRPSAGTPRSLGPGSNTSPQDEAQRKKLEALAERVQQGEIDFEDLADEMQDFGAEQRELRQLEKELEEEQE